MRLQLISTTAPAACLAACLAAGAPAWAQSTGSTGVAPVVVSATRSGQGVRADLLGASFSEISAQQMDDRQIRIVSDVLADVPGLAVSRTGPLGGFAQVRIRGAESNHTLTLVDGMDVSDPFQGEFDYATLIADQVSRVEVLRGQQSALYGSTAIGGVISYITATGAQAPGVSARVEGGSAGTYDGAARVAGVSGPLDYALSASGYSTDGVVGAAGGRRKDGYSDAVVAGKATWTLSDRLRLKAVGRYTDTRADTVDQDFNFPPNRSTYGRAVDGGLSYTNRALIGLVRGEADLIRDRWTAAVTVQGDDTRRRDRDHGMANAGSDGTRTKASAETSVIFGSAEIRNVVTLAIDDKRETYLNIPIGAPSSINTKRAVTNVGYVVEYDGAFFDRLGLGAAIRHDHNDRFQDADTYRAQISYKLDHGVRLRAAAGSGVTNPTNFELFGYDPSSFIGNSNLKPERSEGWEVGGDYASADSAVSVGASYFDNRLKDEINTLFTPAFLSTPVNLTSLSYQKGVELWGSAKLGRMLTLDADYTHLKATENGGLTEVRRPDNSGSVNLTWKDPQDRGSATLTVRYTGRFVDFDFTDPNGPTTRRAMPAFTLVNLAGAWKITPKLELFGRVENLFDKRYQQVFTYQEQGRAGYLGLKASF